MAATLTGGFKRLVMHKLRIDVSRRFGKRRTPHTNPPSHQTDVTFHA